MQTNFYCNSPYINIYERPSINSKISSQIIYGENFKVLRKVKDFFEIRTSYDRYNGYIKNKKFINKIKPTHKVKVLKTKIYKSNSFLPFSSKIEILKKKKNYIMNLLEMFRKFIILKYHLNFQVIQINQKRILFLQ